MAYSLPSVKCVLLGEGRVGKTSLLIRYVQERFNEASQATVQASFMSKRLIVGGQEVELAIWDTAGQERFHALAPIYYRDAHAALLVYDITDADSFERVKTWVHELHAMVGPDIVLAIAANKEDLAAERAVPEAESRAFAAAIGASHHSTSAKTGKDLANAFLSLAQRAMQQRAAKSGRSPAGPGAAVDNRQGAIVLAASESVMHQKSTCCS